MGGRVWNDRLCTSDPAGGDLRAAARRPVVLDADRHVIRRHRNRAADTGLPAHPRTRGQRPPSLATEALSIRTAAYARRAIHEAPDVAALSAVPMPGASPANYEN